MTDWLSSAVLAVALAAMAVGALAAESTDYHEMFESRCAGCHGEHAGDFARAELEVVDGILRGRNSGRDIAAFLPTHFGKLTQPDAAALSEMLRKQVEAGARFQERCQICHVSARDLARGRLIVRDGVLFGRYSGRDVRPFLAGHADLTDAEADFFTEVLRAVTEGSR